MRFYSSNRNDQISMSCIMINYNLNRSTLTFYGSNFINLETGFNRDSYCLFRNSIAFQNRCLSLSGSSSMRSHSRNDKRHCSHVLQFVRNSFDDQRQILNSAASHGHSNPHSRFYKTADFLLMHFGTQSLLYIF